MEPDVASIRRHPSESPTEWLERLERINPKELALNQRTYLAAYLDVARVAVRADEWEKNRRAE